MIIQCDTKDIAAYVAKYLIGLGVGFKVNTLEIFQTGQQIETGDDMWDAIQNLDRAQPHLNLYYRMDY